MRISRVIGIALLVLLGAVLLLFVLERTRGEAPAADPYTFSGAPSIQLIVSPHPDDEMQAVNALLTDPDIYTVWMTVTRGENTSTCNTDSRAWQRVEPQYRPDPAPTGKGTDSCGRARLTSWHTFIDRFGEVTDVPTDPLETLRSVDVAGAFEARIGTSSARLVFDGVNGQLTRARVERFLDIAVAERGKSLPDLPIERVIVASYGNDDEQLGAIYEHAEHMLVREVLTDRDMSAVNGTWIPQPPNGGDIDAVREISPQQYDRLMGFTRSGKPVGAHQIAYRWLVFGGVRSNWAPSRDAVHHRSRAYIWPRRQHFRVVHVADDS
ncbi:MAG: hypothetical protein ABI200_04065 [Gaiellales bacterium]